MKHTTNTLMCGVILIAITQGCAPGRYFSDIAQPASDVTFSEVGEVPQHLPMFTGEGDAIRWDDLIAAIGWAEIVILGEQHDDAMGHAVQLAVVEDTLDRWPSSVVSMEMLERDEQILVDDFLDDIIDTSDFIRLTFSANWGGPNTWEDWFQPIIDAAKQRDARVIAANAPRRYVRLARLAGYDALDALPPQRRALFDRPRSLPRDHYFVRFREVMSHIDNPETLDAFFRSQMVWDATMARSIVLARPSRRSKVIHLVGRFHSDFNGGLIGEIRRYRPHARILTVSMHRLDALEMRDEDHGRADVVIYTGAPEAPDNVDEAKDDDVDPHSEA